MDRVIRGWPLHWLSSQVQARNLHLLRPRRNPRRCPGQGRFLGCALVPRLREPLERSSSPQKGHPRLQSDTPSWGLLDGRQVNRPPLPYLRRSHQGWNRCVLLSGFVSGPTRILRLHQLHSERGEPAGVSHRFLRGGQTAPDSGGPTGVAEASKSEPEVSCQGRILVRSVEGGRVPQLWGRSPARVPGLLRTSNGDLGSGHLRLRPLSQEGRPTPSQRRAAPIGAVRGSACGEGSG